MAMKASNVDISKITLSAVKTMDNGGKMIYLNYDGGINPLLLQTPEVDIPFDLDVAKAEEWGKYNVQCNLKDIEGNSEVKAFHDKLLELDGFIKTQAMENSVAWFKKKKMTEETIDSLYTPQVKLSFDSETGEPNGKYPPKFGFKITRKDNKVACMLYDNKKNVFDVNRETDNPVAIENVLMKGALIKAVLRCNGVWLANGKFGCTWRAEQIRVKIPEGALKAFAVLSDSDSDDEEDTQEQNLIDDSSEEDNQSEENKSDDEEDDEDALALTRQESKPVKKVRRVKVKSGN